MRDFAHASIAAASHTVQLAESFIGRGNPVSSAFLTQSQIVEVDTPPHISQTLGKRWNVVGVVCVSLFECIAVHFRFNPFK